MDYNAWRITYQDPEQAARAAFKLAATSSARARMRAALVAEVHVEKHKLQRQMKVIKDRAIKQAAELLEREVEVRRLRKELELPRDYPHDPAPIHLAFGLSYASWLVLPRVVLESMPQRWQAKLVALIDQMNDRFDWWPEGVQFNVQIKQNGRFVPMPQQFTHYRHPDWHWLESIDRTKQKEPAHG